MRGGINDRYIHRFFQVLEMLSEMVDESDPDNAAPQRFHAYQTAERCRELFPEHGRWSPFFQIDSAFLRPQASYFSQKGYITRCDY